MALENVLMELTYAPPLDRPPMEPKQMYRQACSNDATTLDAWRDIWRSNFERNRAKFGTFADHSAAQFHNSFYQRPCIVAGSGPSLKRNAHLLRERDGIPMISCLHNFGYFTDIGVEPDFYLSLDAGSVVVEEVWNGGKEKDENFYWERTKGKKLIAATVTDPKLFEKWQGEVYFFNPVIPEKAIVDHFDSIERFNMIFSTGGNALGACVYAAKVLMGCNPIVYVGANFSFGYDKKFHAWDSQYDQMGSVIRCIDVWGNSCWTWGSYYNFKIWFDWLSMMVPGIWINATEGGIMGAYPEGNLRSLLYFPLEAVIKMYGFSNRALYAGPDGNPTYLDIGKYFKDPTNPTKFTMY